MYKTREAGIILKQSLEKNEQATCKKCTVIRMRMKTKWYHMSFSHGNYMNCTKCLCKFIRSEAKIIVILLNKYGGYDANLISHSESFDWETSSGRGFYT